MPTGRKKDFESADGFSTKVWGPALWHVLHTISFNFPVRPTATERKQYHQFIKSLGHVLPCGVCRENYRTNLIKAKFSVAESLRDRHTFSRFIYRLHQHVCTTVETKLPCTYTQMRQTYEQFRAKCVPNTPGKHGGCTRSTARVPARCIIHIEPVRGSGHKRSFRVDRKCAK